MQPHMLSQLLKYSTYLVKYHPTAINEHPEDIYTETRFHLSSDFSKLHLHLRRLEKQRPGWGNCREMSTPRTN